MQGNATARIADNSMNAINEVFGERILSRGLWLLRSLDLNHRDFYLQDMLKEKVCVNNPRYTDELRENIRHQISFILI
jgi:hypothetical protein